MTYLAFTLPGGNNVPVPTAVSGITGSLYGFNIIRLAVEILLLFGTLLTLFYFFFAGYKWMSSQGDKKKIEEARNTLIYSAAGLTLLFLSFLIMNVLGAFFNVPLLGNFGQ